MISEEHLDQLVGVGVNLGESFRNKLILFLKKNKGTFASTVGKMTGISTEVISHELNIDPTFKLVKQKRRKLGSDRTEVVNSKVIMLLEAGLIREVKYLEWLANPVVVKKRMASGAFVWISPTSTKRVERTVFCFLTSTDLSNLLQDTKCYLLWMFGVQSNLDEPGRSGEDIFHHRARDLLL